MPTIWHNPRCSKSRQTLQLLQERGLEPTVRRYLEDSPAAMEIEEVLRMLGLEPRQLMRRREAPFAELALKDPSHDRAALVQAMADHPVLIERPVVIHDGKAALGRPPDAVLSLFDR